MTNTTRGIRNNNPCNIRISNSKWQGKDVPSKDADFETFQTPVMGIRAAARLLLGYQEQGLDTIQKIVNKWAPANENNSIAYANFVAEHCGVTPDEAYELDNADNMRKFLRAMIGEENGVSFMSYYSDKVIDDAMRLAGVADVPKPKMMATNEGKAIATVSTVTAITAVSSGVQAAQPTFDLIQKLVEAAPWIATAIGVGVVLFIGYELLKKYKQGVF